MDLETICAAAIQQAGETERERVCVFLERREWLKHRDAFRYMYLFPTLNETGNLNVFMFYGVAVSWSPLVTRADAYVIGQLF